MGAKLSNEKCAELLRAFDITREIPGTPPEVLRRHAEHSLYPVRLRVAYRLDCPPDLLAEMSADRSGVVRSAVEIIRFINSDPRLQEMARNASQEDLAVWAQQIYPPAMRAFAALNIRSSEDIWKLTRDRVDAVRLAALHNPMCSPDILHTAALEWKTYSDLVAISWHPNTGEGTFRLVVEKAKKAGAVSVANMAIARLRRPELDLLNEMLGADKQPVCIITTEHGPVVATGNHLIWTGEKFMTAAEIAEEQAQNQKAAGKSFQQRFFEAFTLAKSISDGVGPHDAAWRGSTRDRCLSEAATSSWRRVQLAVASSLDCPTDILDDLLTGDDLVRETALRTQELTHHEKDLVENGFRDVASRNLYLHSKCTRDREVVARTPHLLADDCLLLAKDPEQSVRSTLFQNPCCPSQALHVAALNLLREARLNPVSENRDLNAIAWHPNTSEETLDLLSERVPGGTRNMALARLKFAHATTQVPQSEKGTVAPATNAVPNAMFPGPEAYQQVQSASDAAAIAVAIGGAPSEPAREYEYVVDLPVTCPGETVPMVVLEKAVEDCLAGASRKRREWPYGHKIAYDIQSTTDKEGRTSTRVVCFYVPEKP